MASLGITTFRPDSLKSMSVEEEADRDSAMQEWHLQAMTQQKASAIPPRRPTLRRLLSGVCRLPPGPGPEFLEFGKICFRMIAAAISQ